MQNLELGTYEGRVIKVNDGMLNLTNMWKACGEDPSMRPNYWVAGVDGRKIALALEEKHIARNSGNKNLIRTATGRNGGTFAHPVIGLAYAKYLSPEFHIWCNEKLLESGLIEVSGGEMAEKRADWFLQDNGFEFRSDFGKGGSGPPFRQN